MSYLINLNFIHNLKLVIMKIEFLLIENIIIKLKIQNKNLTNNKVIIKINFFNLKMYKKQIFKDFSTNILIQIEHYC